MSLNFRDEHLPVAVAARDLKRARQFAAKFGISKAYGNYQDLANDPEVEIAYIGVTTTQHYKVATLMLNSGKHVLCEKALGVSLQQVKEMIALARSKNLFFMEAIWSRTFPIYHNLTSLIDAGCIGDVKHVFCTFGVGGNDAPEARLSKKSNGGGTLLDFGVYCIQMILLAFKGEKPKDISATAININENGVDTGLSVSMHFSNGGFATFNTDLRVTLHNRAIIGGTKGFIRVSSKVLRKAMKNNSQKFFPDCFTFLVSNDNLRLN